MDATIISSGAVAGTPKNITPGAGAGFLVVALALRDGDITGSTATWRGVAMTELISHSHTPGGDGGSGIIFIAPAGTAIGELIYTGAPTHGWYWVVKGVTDTAMDTGTASVTTDDSWSITLDPTFNTALIFCAGGHHDTQGSASTGVYVSEYVSDVTFGHGIATGITAVVGQTFVGRDHDRGICAVCLADPSGSRRSGSFF